MRWSRYYLFTSREVPNDAEVVSHRLMARAGMLRKLAAGVYIYQPFGWRAMSKLMAIVRREMEAVGCVELSMPALQPAELWRESGRWDKYGAELLRFKDRHDRDFCFGPTHEEVITDLVRRDVKSYRQLPLSLYQIQTKFRDEVRPRFGLMRGREFLMKDAYSFHTDATSLGEAYEAMGDAYRKILETCQLSYSAVEADSGTIGGSRSHEFMVLASTGESVVASCTGCDYAANVEKAEADLAAEAGATDAAETELELELVETPGQTAVAEVAEFLGVAPRELVKTLLYDSDQGLLAVAIRGDQVVNEVKLKNHLETQHLALASGQQVVDATGAAAGFSGPVGLPDSVPLLGDLSVEGAKNFVCGANKTDFHYTGVNWKRDAEPTRWVDLREVADGDLCRRCGSPLRRSRGIEVGHTFMLGSAYSEAMGCTFVDHEGRSHAMIMGCYGLGIGRTVAAAIEQNHDDDGIIWPLALAPFQVLLVALNVKDEEVRAAAEDLYHSLEDAGIDVLYDDRDERPGVKFKDADLIGIPVRIVIGARSLADGAVELSLRRDGQKHPVQVGDAVARVVAECR